STPALERDWHGAVVRRLLTACDVPVESAGRTWLRRGQGHRASLRPGRPLKLSHYRGRRDEGGRRLRSASRTVAPTTALDVEPCPSSACLERAAPCQAAPITPGR